MKLIRTIISEVVEGVIKRFSGSGRPEETFEDREYLQHYGFTSRPLADAEGVVLMQGNQIFLIASDDRRYRIAIEDGEVALYTDEGDKIHLKRNKEILVSSGKKITINAPEVIVNADTSAKVISPVVELGQAAGHLKLMNENLEILFNTHTHSGVSSGSSNSGMPNQLSGSAHKTANLKST